MAKASPAPGTCDIFPGEIGIWHKLEACAKDVFSRYGFGELRTPIFEYTELFERGIGNDTEVVQKEMYTFEDRGGRSLTLRPEGTAGIMRALLATDVMNGNEQRVYYLGPMFRGERPAAGRRRQFHQVGVENAGRISPELDAECIAMMMHYLQTIGLARTRLIINTRGALDERATAGQKLRDFFAPRISGMCDDCQSRIGRNPWRILDCKQDACRKEIAQAPPVADLFCQESRDFFAAVCQTLETMKVPYTIDPHLVRGLDYYVHTVFEVVHDGLGAQSALAGGGRYEVFLPETKRPVPGVGFAAGLERILMAMDAEQILPPEPPGPTAFLVGLGEQAVRQNLALAAELRGKGVPVIVEVEAMRSLKAQLRAAGRANARFAIIRGESEIESETVLLKELASGEQRIVPSSEIFREICAQ